MRESKNKENSIKLANIMGWELSYEHDKVYILTYVDGFGVNTPLEPYLKTDVGYRLFAIIFLRYPKVVDRFNSKGSKYSDRSLDQEGILDEIINMKYTETLL